jgi:hypothetical protein
MFNTKLKRNNINLYIESVQNSSGHRKLKNYDSKNNSITEIKDIRKYYEYGLPLEVKGNKILAMKLGLT